MANPYNYLPQYGVGNGGMYGYSNWTYPNSVTSPSTQYQYNTQAPQQTPVNGLIRVTGIEGAKAYQMPPNSNVALFDANNDIMYIKTTDGAGFPTIKTFGFAPVDLTAPQEKQPDMSQFVTRDEFEKLKVVVSEYGKQSVSQKSAEPVANSE